MTEFVGTGIQDGVGRGWVKVILSPVVVDGESITLGNIYVRLPDTIASWEVSGLDDGHWEIDNGAFLMVLDVLGGQTEKWAVGVK